MSTDAPLGASGDVSRDGEDMPSRAVVQNFHSETLPVPSAWSYGHASCVKAYFDGENKFCVTFGEYASGPVTAVWTTGAGLEAVIHSCQYVLDRARRELAEASEW